MNPPLHENKVTLTWNSLADCIFSAIVVNGNITELNFCEPPGKAGADIPVQCLHSINEKFLRDVHNNLGELIDFVDRKRNETASFSNDVKY
jgi:hypothetical protein